MRRHSIYIVRADNIRQFLSPLPSGWDQTVVSALGWINYMVPLCLCLSTEHNSVLTQSSDRTQMKIILRSARSREIAAQGSTSLTALNGVGGAWARLFRDLGREEAHGLIKFN